jgi:hypothetical protein
VAVLLTDADFYPDEAIAAYAWPLLVQAADLAEVVSGRLCLTDRGRAALAAPAETTIRHVWRRWISHAVIDELSRVEHIKGQRAANALTSAKNRRQAVAAALADCPVGQWLTVEDLFMRMRRSGYSPTIARSERGLWKLYLADPQYGSFGYAGFHGWTLLEGRYTLAVLFEYGATLGLIDVAYDRPAGAREDFRGNWGADELDYLSRYDGLRSLRLNALGAWVLGLSDHYSPAASATATGSLRVLPTGDVVALGELTLGEQMTLSAFAAQPTERVWRLTSTSVVAALTAGRTLDELVELLSRLSGTELPQPVRILIDDIADRARLLTDLGPVRLLECRDAATATLLSRDRELRRLCRSLGDRFLAVPAEHESAFRARLPALGYLLTRP